MIIRVYDGEIDASKLSIVTPVMPVETDDPETKDVVTLYALQITCDGTRTTLNYNTKEEAEAERNFIVGCWLQAKGQFKSGIIVRPGSIAEGEVDVTKDANKDKEPKKT